MKLAPPTTDPEPKTKESTPKSEPKAEGLMEALEKATAEIETAKITELERRLANTFF